MILLIATFYYFNIFTEYTDLLMKRLFTEYLRDPAALRDSIADIRDHVPAPLSAQYGPVVKEELVADYESRFSDLTLNY